MSTTTKLLTRKPRREVAVFCRHPDDANTLAELNQAAARTKAIAERTIGKPPTATQRKAAREAEKAVDDFLAQVDTITFHLRAIGTKRYEKLLAKYPPTTEQVERHEADRQAQNDALKEAGAKERVPGLTYDPDRFLPELIAKSTERLVVTGDDGGETDEIAAEDIATLIFDSDGGWSQQDQQRLIMICTALNQAGSGIDRDLVGRLGNG